MFARARVCECVRVCVGAQARQCACPCLALIIQHAMRLRQIATTRAPPYFSVLSHKRHFFWKKIY